MGRVNGHTAEQVIDAIHEAHGLPTLAAQKLGIAVSTIYNYINRYPTIKKALDDERNVWVDIAESELIKLIKKGNVQAIMFFLKTVGKSRGYVERQEITGAEGQAVVIQVKYADDNIIPAQAPPGASTDIP